VEAIERVKESLMEDGDGGLALGGVRSTEEGDRENDDSGDPDANSGVEYLPAPQGTTAMGPYKKKKKLASIFCFRRVWDAFESYSREVV
jgi:hypothetical protein